MSVIVGRALPDARDGLKPVQRRILYAMHELGLTPERPYRKCARVVGDVLGKYHPHGDQAVYDALVRLVQEFSSRYPVLDGHGNFGSVDDDPPAAMRYTETRLASISNVALLDEIGSETVDFASNFDGSQQEPVVLPAQLPFLLLNGCSGIAVGMATSIPPHNLNEIVEGLIALVKNPELKDEDLIKLIPGPDFPTGGEILMGSGIKETYLKGKGSIPMRGILHVEETQPGKGKHKRTAIVITELPFQVSKAGWIEKLAELVNDGKISGISDIRDESDRDGMRIIIELRRDSDPTKVSNSLYNRTSLQSNFGATLLAIVEGQPKQLKLKELLTNFLEFRELTIIKRTRYILKKTKDRLEVVEGLISALTNLRKVIDLIEQAKDASEASTKLIVQLNINAKQSEAILGMPLRRLTTLEQEGLKKELKSLANTKKELEDLIANRDKLLQLIINELKALKKTYGNNRKTILVEGGDELIAQRQASQRPSAELQRKQALESLPSDAKILIQTDNEVKIISQRILNRLNLLEECILSNETNTSKLVWDVNKNPKLIAITEQGKIAIIKWEFAGQQPGKIEKFLPNGLEGEKIITILPLIEGQKSTLGLLSTDGRFKRIALEEILDLSGRATSILKLKEQVRLQSAIMCCENKNLVIITNWGRILKLKINSETIPIMGKLAQGSTSIKLFPGEKVIGSVAEINIENNGLALFTRNGLIRKIDFNDLRTSNRGEFGSIRFKLNKINNERDEIISATSSNILVNIITNKDRKCRLGLGNEVSNQIKLDLNLDEVIIDVIPTIQNN